MANNSTPRTGVATVRSAVNAMFTIPEGKRPTELQIQQAIAAVQKPRYEFGRGTGKLIAGTPGLHRDGRFYAAWAPMTSNKHLGKPKKLRVL